MKKRLSLILSFVLCLCLCACGESANKLATVNDNSGKTEKLSAKELVSLHNENEPNFERLYKNAPITATATVEKVETVGSGGVSIISSRKDAYRITTKEGWVVTVLVKQHENVVELKRGDLIQFTSKIGYVFLNRVWVEDYSTHNSKDYTDLKILS